MLIPVKKLESGFEIPVYGFGTWQMGGRRERDFDNDDEADVKAIQAAIDAGVTHFDTAELYAAGHSEEILGRAISDTPRSNLFIASKVLGDNLEPLKMRKSLEDSLERTGVEYFDLYMPHFWNNDVPIKQTMAELSKAVDEGLIKKHRRE